MMTTKTEGLLQVQALVAQAMAEFRGEYDDQAAWALGDLVSVEDEIVGLLPLGTMIPAPPERSGADPVHLLEEAARVLGNQPLGDDPAGVYVALSHVLDAARYIKRRRGDLTPLEVVWDARLP